MIQELKDNEIFVYGTNKRAFHGAGAASYAFCGTTKNDWRDNPIKQAAIYNPSLMNVETGRINRIGRWNIWGLYPTGLAKGYSGFSYGICTVENPGGAKVSSEFIRSQISDLVHFATHNPKYNFVFSKFGCGLAGFKEWEMDGIVSSVIEKDYLPPSLNKLKTLFKA